MDADDGDRVIRTGVTEAQRSLRRAVLTPAVATSVGGGRFSRGGRARKTGMTGVTAMTGVMGMTRSGDRPHRWRLLSRNHYRGRKTESACVEQWAPGLADLGLS
ncbi:hypothetical protein GCM10009814_40430 [Lapillicoccus jejuensis]